MMNTLVLLIMCIGKMIYLALPTLIFLELIFYRFTKASLIKEIIELLK